MNRQISNGNRSKKPVLLWVVLGIAAALTAGLMVFLGIQLFFPGGAEKPAEKDRYPYSEEEELEYFRGFDATVLAASVCGVYPDADGATLALGSDECFLRMDISTQEETVPIHFSLRSTDMAFTGEFPGYDLASIYTSFLLENIQAGEAMSARYANHLETVGGDVTAVYFRDYDSDGLDESILLVTGFVDNWLENAAGNDVQRTAREALLGQRICVYLDPDSRGNLVIHSAALPDSLGNVTEAVWDNGMIHLLDAEGTLWRFLAGECELSMADFAQDDTAMSRLCARFADLMADRGYTDIRLRLADVSTAPGKELLCCYSDGRNYYAAVYAVRTGCLYPLYCKAGTDGSVYLVEYNGGFYLLDYAQDLSDDYAQSYSYTLFRFDEGYNMRVEDSNSLRVEANQGGGSAGSSFFSRLNGYLNAGSVCYDPYGLMGYTVMQEHDGIVGGEQVLYLNITNCSTNKVGVITLQDDDSWLNFRSGPSTAYDRVLINTYDPESYVKQVQGSLVTVIMPYNTGDRDNPIWAQIRINYQNRTLEGYSSQRFIRIDGIRHIAVGERFAITVQTNDTGVRWYCSDTAVASIDESGSLTGIKPGLVLVTVISDSGLEDSCLIMID